MEPYDAEKENAKKYTGGTFKYAYEREIREVLAKLKKASELIKHNNEKDPRHPVLVDDIQMLEGKFNRLVFWE